MAIVVNKPVFQFDLEIPLSDFEAFNSEDVPHLSFMTLGFHTPSAASGYSLPEDRVLSEPAKADSWNDIRRNVLFRMRIAATGQALVESTVDQTNDIAKAIAAELGGR